MFTYFLKRLGLVIPTLIGILTINFFVIQMAPGGPVEQFIAKMEGSGDVFMERVGSSMGDFSTKAEKSSGELRSNANQRIDPEILDAVKKLYGFDKPIGERYVQMLKDFLSFDFGNSLFKADSVTGLIKNALPVSISLGLWSTLLIYIVSIPLGMIRAMRANTTFDVVSGSLVVMGSAIPGFLFAVLLIVLFAGGSYWQIFPLRGLTSLDPAQASWWALTLDYAHHMVLPILSMTIGGFAGLTLLTRNSFLDELGKQYVVLARSKGLNDRQVLFGHVFRNAMLIVISGFPGTFVRMFFAGSLLIETIFSLNGLGLLGFEATMQRDYPVMFATLYIFTLIGLLTSILGDLTMMLVDPRIDFTSRRKV